MIGTMWRVGALMCVVNVAVGWMIGIVEVSVAQSVAVVVFIVVMTIVGSE